MLITGISLYEKAGDKDSADYLRRRLVEMPLRLETLKYRLSDEGKKIKDQPRTTLPVQITEYIEKTEVYLENK